MFEIVQKQQFAPLKNPFFSKKSVFKTARFFKIPAYPITSELSH